jgi:hypothetical protein
MVRGLASATAYTSPTNGKPNASFEDDVVSGVTTTKTFPRSV